MKREKPSRNLKKAREKRAKPHSALGAVHGKPAFASFGKGQAALADRPDDIQGSIGIEAEKVPAKTAFAPVDRAAPGAAAAPIKKVAVYGRRLHGAVGVEVLRKLRRSVGQVDSLVGGALVGNEEKLAGLEASEMDVEPLVLS